MTVPTAAPGPVPPAIDENPLAGPSRVPRALRSIVLTVPFGYLAVFMAIGLSSLFSAVQVQNFDPAGKVASLGLLSAITAFAAMLTQPIVGTLSDRTRSRFGARSPWILVGGVLTGVALITAGLAPSLVVLIVAIAFVQIGVNAAGAPMSALLPDRVPPRLRGRYSTFAGLGTIFGGVLGPVLGSVFAQAIPAGYTTVAGFVVIVLALVAVFARTDNRGEEGEPFNALLFVKAFWVNPVRHPDFFWGFMGRILIIGGFNLINVFTLYILQDYLGLALNEAIGLVPLLGIAALPGLIIAAVIAGPLSDRIGRRKPLVLAAGLIITVAAVIPLVMPSVPGVIISNVIAGFGFGAFTAVDQALITSVLPNQQNYGKDLGVINIAQTLPNVIAPAIASAVVLIAGYPALYGFIAVVALLGALAVVPIRSVR